MTTMTIGERLLALKERSGLSLNALAKGAGYSGASSVQSFFNAGYDPPGLDISVARKLAIALVGRGSPEITQEELFSLLEVRSIIQSPSKRIEERKNVLDADVPVFETRRWNQEVHPQERTFGLGLMLVNRLKVVRYYPRPAGLMWSDNAFALHMAGKSMSPRFEDGEPIFVSGHREPAVGDDVIISLRLSEIGTYAEGTELVTLGRLTRFDDAIHIVQHGGSKPGTISPAAMIRIERISPWAEVCGLPYA